MRFSLRATTIVAAIIAILCFGFALTGFRSLGDLADPTELADARGFAWFWVFLGSLTVVLALAAWWIARKSDEHE